MSEPENWDRRKVWSSYADWSKAYDFAGKSGFELTRLQALDAEQFCAWGSAANFYEVGGGKSAVSSVVAMMRGHAQKLVIVPPILITPWATWLHRVSADVLVYRGTPRERAAMKLKQAHWIVMSHGIFRDDFQKLERALDHSLEIIVDEAHALKNVKSQLFKKVQRLTL